MTHRSSIFVEHDIQVAHRLLLLPGKCENIHGHSMTVRMTIWGHVDENGILAGLDFGEVKRTFRAYLDGHFDHHLHLNSQDPWAKVLQDVDQHNAADHLPGLVTWPNDPTTENFARWIHDVMDHRTLLLGLPIRIDIRETKTNGASYGEI